MEWPKCDYNDRRAKIYCQGGSLYSCGKSLHENCHICKGTGEKAELTEAEAIAYLCQAPGPVTIRLLNNSHVLIDYNGITIASGEIKRALNEAARAVKERNGA